MTEPRNFEQGVGALDLRRIGSLEEFPRPLLLTVSPLEKADCTQQIRLALAAFRALGLDLADQLARRAVDDGDRVERCRAQRDLAGGKPRASRQVAAVAAAPQLLHRQALDEVILRVHDHGEAVVGDREPHRTMIEVARLGMQHLIGMDVQTPESLAGVAADAGLSIDDAQR